MAVFGTAALHSLVACIRDVAFGWSLAVTALVSTVSVGPAVCGWAAIVASGVVASASAASGSSVISMAASTAASTSVPSPLVLVDLGL